MRGEFFLQSWYGTADLIMTVGPHPLFGVPSCRSTPSVASTVAHPADGSMQSVSPLLEMS
jgi:hypothetical protein